MLYLDALKFEPVANIIHTYIYHRKLVLLGDSLNLRNLLLEKYQLQPEYIATSVESNLKKGKEYRMLSDFANKSDEYYICIPFLQYNENLKKKIESYGYKEFKDFVFTYHKGITLPPGTKNYMDEYGNKVISTGSFQVILLSVAGNNVVNVDDKVVARGNSNIIMEECGGEIQIEKDSRVGFDAHFEVFSHSKIFIHEKSSFANNFTARASAGSVIDIGRDSMFSYDIEMYAGDGHSIFDVESHERVNECYPHNEKNDIIIGQHVWAGLRCTILSGRIGKNSIIGAGAVVKGELPQNCVAVGNPAVVKKIGVTWSRNPYAKSIRECGEEFENI